MANNNQNSNSRDGQKNSSSSLHYNEEFSSKQNPEDIARINNRATNSQTYNHSPRGYDDDDEENIEQEQTQTNASSELQEQESQTQSQETNVKTNDGSGNKSAVGSKIKSAAMNKLTGGKSAGKSAAGKLASKIGGKGGLLKGKFSALKIKLILWGCLIAFGLIFMIAMILMISSLFTSLTTFFGAKEGVEEGDTYEGEVLVSDENLYKGECDGEEGVNGDDCTALTLDELVTKMKEENTCNIGNIFSEFGDGISYLFGTEFNGACGIIRFIRKSIEAYESRYSVNIDEGLILATIFYGYDQQPTNNEYEENDNDNSEENNNETQREAEPSNHFQVLENIAKDGIIKRTDIVRMIKASIYEEIYPYWTWSVTEDEDTGKRTGTCTQHNVQNYYGVDYNNTNAKSYHRWKLFMRYNDNFSTTATCYTACDGSSDNKCEESCDNDGSGFSVSGILTQPHGLFGGQTDTLTILRNSVNPAKIYGSGYVYEANMNAAWRATDEECNGTIDVATLKEKYDLDSVSGTGTSHGFFEDRGITGETDMSFYNQYVDDIHAAKTYEFQSDTRTHTTGGSPQTTNIEMDYRNGYAYQSFPSFKRAIEELKLEDYKYNPYSTNKEIEMIIEEILSRKNEFSEILMFDVSADNSVTTAYCGDYLTTTTDKIQVKMTDCAGNTITTTNFKDYIMGVTYAEIGVPSNDDYVITQMVAAINFTLARHGNYRKGETIDMKSGSCDQNWCSITQGCYRRNTVHANGKTYGSTYPGGNQSYKRIMSAEQQERYSRLYDTASRYLMLEPDGSIRPGYYVSGTQKGWESKAEDGKSYLEILSEEYEDATIVDCTEASIDGSTPTTPGSTIDIDVPDPTSSQREWGQKIAETAKYFLDNLNSKFCYTKPKNHSKRIDSYNKVSTALSSGAEITGNIETDCNSFVGIVVNAALRIGPKTGTSVGNITIAGPSGGTWVVRDYYKNCVTRVANKLTLDQALSKAQPGDLLASNGPAGESTHIQVYYGNGVIIDNGNAGKRGCNGVLAMRNKNGGTGYRKISHQGGSWSIFRVTSLTCN